MTIGSKLEITLAIVLHIYLLLPRSLTRNYPLQNSFMSSRGKVQHLYVQKSRTTLLGPFKTRLSGLENRYKLQWWKGRMHNSPTSTGKTYVASLFSL